MEKVICPICGGKEFEFLFSGRDYLHEIAGEFNVVRCPGCRLILTNPILAEAEIARYYPEDYQPYGFNRKKIERQVKFKKHLPLLFHLIDSHEYFVPDLKKPARILEIGSGGGSFLFEYRLNHPNHYICASDFNEEVVEKLENRGFEAFVSNLKDIPGESNFYDLVFGWMVLEHVHDINRALGEIRRVLKVDGLFCFSIPNAGSWEFGAFREKWYATQVPTHLYHFDSESIGKILAKNGFEVVKIIHQRSFANFFKSLENLTKFKKDRFGIYKLIRKAISWNKFYFLITLPLAYGLSALGQSGRITIVARRKT